MYSGGDLIESRLEFGLAHFESVCAFPDEVMVGETTTLGLQVSDQGLLMGYRDSQRACLPERCQVLLWIDSETQLRELSALIPDLPNVCMAPTSRSRGNR